MVRVFVIDDHEIMRAMLHDFLDMEPDLSVCGEAATAEDALATIAESAPDLVLVDVKLPDMSGIEVAELLRERYPGLPVTMLSAHGERSYVRQALQAGARGYILKGDAEQIPDAIRKIMLGERYLSTILAGDS